MPGIHIHFHTFMMTLEMCYAGHQFHTGKLILCSLILILSVNSGNINTGHISSSDNILAVQTPAVNTTVWNKTVSCIMICVTCVCLSVCVYIFVIVL